MRLWPKKPEAVVAAPDHRTEELLGKMDVFLAEMQTVADRIVEKLNEGDKANG